MTPAAIVQAAAADGVRLALTEAGTLKTIGHPDSVQHWLPRLREHKNEIVQLLAADTDPTAAPATGWLIHFADRDPMEVWTAPPSTHAEVLAIYPDAIAAEPIPEVLGRSTDADSNRKEAIGLALADPDGALTCYRAIAAGRGLSVSKPASTEPAPAHLCRSCRHRATPGRADPGYCAQRDDLPKAYGDGHPLHRLPADGGIDCPKWAPYE